MRMNAAAAAGRIMIHVWRMHLCSASCELPNTALFTIYFVLLFIIDNDEDKVTIPCCIVASSTVLAPLGPLPIKAVGARRPPAAPGARGSAQRELRTYPNEDDVKRKRWTLRSLDNSLHGRFPSGPIPFRAHSLQGPFRLDPIPFRPRSLQGPTPGPFRSGPVPFRAHSLQALTPFRPYFPSLIASIGRHRSWIRL